MSGLPVIDSGAEDNGELDFGTSEPFTGFPALGSLSTGDAIDAEIVDDEILEPEPERERPVRTRRTAKATESAPESPRDAKSGPPSLDEWTGFFSRVVLRSICDWYINYAFRGVDEDSLSDREVERLALSDDERKLISVPFAELSNKSKFMRKHGRTIVASGDAFNAMVVFGAWMSRVNRISNKYKPRHSQRGKVNLNGSSGQGTPQASPNGFGVGTSGGRFPEGFSGGVIPGSG